MRVAMRFADVLVVSSLLMLSGGIAPAAAQERFDIAIISDGQNDRLAVDVPLAGLGSAVGDADLVLLETDALGPDSAICSIGSLTAAAVAAQGKAK